jgi:hypothetical protein
MIMRARDQKAGKESGVALLISLFALLLICVVGVALIMASGTDTALTGNYHSATSVYYAALAGLEEGRGRLLPKSPNYLTPAFVAPVGGLLAPGEVRYILNPNPGETVAPWDVGTPATFPDTEYTQEFGTDPPGSPPTVPSVSSSSGIQGPMYKWVRINAITAPSERKAGVNVDNDTGGPGTPILYNNTTLTISPPGAQALEITSLASMGNGSQRMLQYVVAPITYNLLPPAALTMVTAPGTPPTFTGPGASLTETGTDTATAACTTTTGATLPGIGVSAGADLSLITGTNISPTPPGPGPSFVSLPANLQTAGALETLIQTIEASADKYSGVVDGPQNETVLPAGMSATTPVTVAVDNDLDLSHWRGAGYGVLLVTGTLTYNGSSTWNGLVLAIGKGQVVSTTDTGGGIYGAAVVAQTRDLAGRQTGTLGTPSWLAPGGSTITYSSCWANLVQPPITYKILSFREICPTSDCQIPLLP